VYYFSGAATKSRFLADPMRYSGPLTDPVTQERFQPTGRSPKTDYHGRTYYFSSAATRGQFAAAPDSFSVRREN
jgi:YHS domain-containing protein